MRTRIHTTNRDQGAAAAAAAEPPRVLRVVPAAPVTSIPLGDSGAHVLPGGHINPAASYLAGLRPSGRRSMRSRLNLAARLLSANSTVGTFPWQDLKAEHVRYVLTRLTLEGRSPSTVNLTRIALRQTAHAARQLGYLSIEDEHAIRDVRGARNENLPRGRMLCAEEKLAIFESCAAEGTHASARDACLFALALGAGLRREECAELSVEAFDQASGTVRLRGKGGTQATLPLPAAAVSALRHWLAVRGGGRRVVGPLLAPVTKADVVRAGRKLSGEAIYKIVRRRAELSGISSCTPHDLRRTFISELLDVTDAETARSLARHSSFATTGRYDRRPERARFQAIKGISVPYRRPRPKRSPRKRKGKRRKGYRRA